MTLPPFGQDPLGYIGLVAAQQPNFITADRDPTVNDQQDPGTQWFNRSANPKKIYESLGAGQWGTAPAANNSWVVATTSPYNLAVGNNLLFDALTGQINLPNISASAGIAIGYSVEILAITSVSSPGIIVQAVATADNIIFAPATNDFKNLTSTSTGAAIKLIVVEKTGSTGFWQVVSSMGSWTGGS